MIKIHTSVTYPSNSWKQESKKRAKLEPAQPESVLDTLGSNFRTGKPKIETILVSVTVSTWKHFKLEFLICQAQIVANVRRSSTATFECKRISNWLYIQSLNSNWLQIQSDS